jgi:hypothetical protein
MNKNCLYIHVPKTGGQSFEDFINENKLGYVKYCDHNSLAKIYNDYKDVWNEYIKIAWVRNPYSWAVSLWCWENVYREQYKKALSVHEFQKAFINPELWTGPWHYAIGKMCRWTHLNGIKAVDYIGRFESFKTSLEESLCLFNAKHLIDKFPHKNKIDNKIHWTKYYEDEKFRQHVRPILKEDCLRFGYEIF